MKEKQTSMHRTTGTAMLTGSVGRKILPYKPTAAKPLILSASELREFIDCRVKWNWRYNARLESLGGSKPLSIGSLTHNGLDLYYQTPFKRRKERTMMRIAAKLVKDTTLKALDVADKELVEAMLNGYSRWSLQEDPKIGLQNCFPEEEFELPLVKDGSIIIRGKLDNRFIPTVLRRVMALSEFKTAKQFQIEKIDLDVQLSVYLWALRKKFPGYRRYIAYYNVLRKQMPTDRVTAPLFYREEVERSDDEIEQWVRDTRRIAKDIVGAAIYPNPGDRCGWACDFKNACMLRGSPADVAHVLKTEYSVREKH